MMLIYITAALVLLYCTVMIWLYDWQPSISNTFCELPLGYKWIFTLFMCTLGVLCMFIGKNNTMVLMGFSCILVGFFPRFNDDQGLQHYIAAIGIIGSGLWQVGVVSGLWYLPIIFLIISLPIYFLKVRNRLFWVEIVAFGVIIGGLLSFFYH